MAKEWIPPPSQKCQDIHSYPSYVMYTENSTQHGKIRKGNKYRVWKGRKKIVPIYSWHDSLQRKDQGIN